MMSAMIRNFILGNLVLALLIGALSTAVFFFLAIPSFFIAGILTGLFSLVPYFAALLAAFPSLFLGVGGLTLAGVGWDILDDFCGALAGHERYISQNAGQPLAAQSPGGDGRPALLNMAVGRDGIAACRPTYCRHEDCVR
jgi:hypothetical protein